jgi:hypothetical protein
MAVTRAIFEGLQIITRRMTEDEFNGYTFNPGHDQIWCGKYEPDRMTAQELKDLESLGWFESEESWSIFT